MIPIKINDKKVSIPTVWSDVTFKQYLQYIDLKEPKVIDAVALFTGIPKETWEKSKEVQNYYIIVDALGFLSDDPKVDDADNPGTVTIKGKQYRVPVGLDKYAVRQFEDMRGLIRMEAKAERLSVKVYPKVISIYLSELIFGEYTPENADKTEPLLMDLGMYEVIGMGNFFLQNMTVLLNGMQSGKQTWGMIVRKLKRAFTGLQSGAFSTN